MTDAEILSLAYQRQQGGDSRTLAQIVGAIKADAEKLFAPTPPAPDAVVGESRVVLRDGTVKRYEHLGDGTKREVA